MQFRCNCMQSSDTARSTVAPQVEAEQPGADGADPFAGLSKTQRKKLMKRQQ